MSELGEHIGVLRAFSVDPVDKAELPNSNDPDELAAYGRRIREESTGPLWFDVSIAVLAAKAGLAGAGRKLVLGDDLGVDGNKFARFVYAEPPIRDPAKARQLSDLILAQITEARKNCVMVPDLPEDLAIFIPRDPVLTPAQDLLPTHQANEIVF